VPSGRCVSKVLYQKLRYKERKSIKKTTSGRESLWRRQPPGCA
jgi:hypothetical protein